MSLVTLGIDLSSCDETRLCSDTELFAERLLVWFERGKSFQNSLQSMSLEIKLEFEINLGKRLVTNGTLHYDTSIAYER